jgi:hypothetical protein
MPPATPSEIRSTIDAICTMESAKLKAGLTSVVRSLSPADGSGRSITHPCDQQPDHGNHAVEDYHHYK